MFQRVVALETAANAVTEALASRVIRLEDAITAIGASVEAIRARTAVTAETAHEAAARNEVQPPSPPPPGASSDTAADPWAAAAAAAVRPAGPTAASAEVIEVVDTVEPKMLQDQNILIPCGDNTR